MAAGGARHNEGRPKKDEVLKLVERLRPMEDIAFEALKAGVESGKFEFIKLYLEYYVGKPQDKVDITSDGEKINQWVMTPAQSKK